MSLTKATLCHFYVGNPGAGKSTLANANAGEIFFKSGVSTGEGKTKRLDIRIKDGVAYVDTPGLADENLRKQAAAAISEALKTGGVFQVIFVCKQDSGRVRASDVTTMKLVLNACDEIVENKFGVIVNMCSGVIMERMKNDEERLLFRTILQQSLPRKTTFVFFLKKHDLLEDQEDQIVPMSELNGYQDFLEQLPTVTLTQGKAKDVKADEFDELNAKIEEKDQAMKKLVADAKQQNKEAMAELAKMKADHNAEMERIKESSGASYNDGFTFGSVLGGIAQMFGGDGRDAKRKVDSFFGV